MMESFPDVLIAAIKRTGRCGLIDSVYPSIATDPGRGGALRLAENRVRVRRLAAGEDLSIVTGEAVEAELREMEAEGLDVSSARTPQVCSVRRG